MRACSFLALLLLAASLFCLSPSPALAQSGAPAELVLGAVLPLSGAMAGSGYRAWLLLNQSLADLRTNLPNVLPNTTLRLVVEDGRGSITPTARATLRLAQRGVVGILGGAEGLSNENGKVTGSVPAGQGAGSGPGSAQTGSLAWMAASLPDPLVTMALSNSACRRGLLDNTDEFPLLVRMCVKEEYKARATLSALMQFGWRQLAILAMDSMDGWGSNTESAADPLGSLLGPGQSDPDYIVHAMIQMQGAEVAKRNLLRLRVPSNPTLATRVMKSLLLQLQQSDFRIVLVYLQGEALTLTMRLAHSMGMMQYPYVWIGSGSYAGPSSTSGYGTGRAASGGMGPGLCSSALINNMADLTPSVPSVDASAGTLVSTYQSSDIGAMTNAATYVYQTDLAMTSSPLLGAFCLSPATPNTPRFTNLKYKLADKGVPFTSVLSSGDESTYDSIIVWAQALHALIQANVTFNATTGRFPAARVKEAILAVNLPAAGLVPLSFDATGNRPGMLDLHNYDPYGSSSGAFVRRGSWSSTSGNLSMSDVMLWSDGSYTSPPDRQDSFQNGQTITPTSDGAVLALAYGFVVLPSFLFFYNVRRLAKGFIQGGDSDDWHTDALRAFLFFSIPGVFASVQLNLLAFSWPIGSMYQSAEGWVGSVLFCVLLFSFVVFAPLAIEARLAIRRGAESKDDLVELYELHLEDGEEVEAEAAAPVAGAAGAKGAQDKEAKEKEAKAAAAAAARAKAREEKKRAKKGKLMRVDEANLLERELTRTWEHTTWGMALSSGLFAALVSGAFFLAIRSLRMPLHVDIDRGGVFGVFLLEWAVFHFLLVRAWRDSRNTSRVLSSLALPAALLMSFQANWACLTLRYYLDPMRRALKLDYDPGSNAGTVASDEVAIAHAIIFAVPFFVGLLQLIKALKLSRHSLDSVLLSMKAKLAGLEATLEAAKTARKTAAAETDHLKRIVELANLARPLHRNHALAFVMADSASTTGAGGVAGADADAKANFIPASFVQEQARGTPARAPVNSKGLAIRVPAGSNSPATSFMDDRNSKMDVPGTPTRKGATLAQASAGVSSAALSELDFGFLARPKAELTGYKLLNELSLELFLGSGPVHHRAVADIHLSHILSHPLTLEIFKDSLTRSNAQETLAFWLDVQRFKHVKDENLRRTLAEAMVATFIYSDAPYPLNFLSAGARESVLSALFNKKARLRSTMFQLVEAELLAVLAKDFANFATTTGFKVCAFLLGHSSYRPSTRIKTLHSGGAVVGDGGKFVALTQNRGPANSMVGDQSAAGGVGLAGAELSASAHPMDDPHSSVGALQRGAAAGAAGDSKMGGARAGLTDSPKAQRAIFLNPSATAAAAAAASAAAGGLSAPKTPPPGAMASSSPSPQPIDRSSSLASPSGVVGGGAAAPAASPLASPSLQVVDLEPAVESTPEAPAVHHGHHLGHGARHHSDEADQADTTSTPMQS